MSAIIKQSTHRIFHDEERNDQLAEKNDSKNGTIRITFCWELIKIKKDAERRLLQASE